VYGRRAAAAGATADLEESEGGAVVAGA
jgi:hypothetical protein